MNRIELVLFFKQQIQRQRFLAGLQLSRSFKNDSVNTQIKLVKHTIKSQYKAAKDILKKLKENLPAIIINLDLEHYQTNYQEQQKQHDTLYLLIGLEQLGSNLLPNNFPENFFS